MPFFCAHAAQAPPLKRWTKQSRDVCVNKLLDKSQFIDFLALFSVYENIFDKFQRKISKNHLQNEDNSAIIDK